MYGERNVNSIIILQGIFYTLSREVWYDYSTSYSIYKLLGIQNMFCIVCKFPSVCNKAKFYNTSRKSGFL